MNDIDILAIHQDILKKFQKEDESNLDNYHQKLNRITESLELPNLLHKTFPIRK